MFQFRPLSELHLEHVRRGISAAVTSWSMQWIGKRVVAQVAVDSAGAVAVSSKVVWKKHGEQSIYVQDSSLQRSCLVRAMSGEFVSGETPPVLARWSSLALEALLNDIVGQDARLIDLDVLPDECVQACSGYAMCSLGLGDLSLVVLVDAFLPILHALTEKSPQRNEPLSLRADAITGVPVQFDVQLHNTSIQAQQLVALSVGDVIELEHELSQPLRVVAPGNISLGQAYLGKVGASRAITPIKSN